MSDVFISYVEEDADVVEPLAQRLTEAGFSCWYYQRSSLPGASYLQQISDALSQAKVVLLVLSPQTLDSFQVDKEISFAHECNKPFLPITRNLAWGDFQQRRPTWRLAVGTSVAIPLPGDDVASVLPRLVQGLATLGVGATKLPAAVSPSVATEKSSAAATAPLTTTPLPVQARGATVAAPGSLPTRTALVGRSAEVDFLKAQYEAVAAGQGGRLVFISGEPGVGKTRLAHEVGLYAWSQGGAFLEGTYLRDGTAPYGPWVDALQTGLRSCPRDVLAPVVAFGAELAQLFPALDVQFGPFTPLDRSPEEQRRRLFDGLAELVAALSQPTPLVLLVNDLQWAQGMAILLHLARRLSATRALVIATYREQEFHEQPVLRKDWLELNRERLATQLTLRPLAESDSYRLIAQYLGASAAALLKDLVYRRTNGNAFFIEEVLRSLVETGAVRPGDAGWEVIDASRVTVPQSMQAVVEERVERLGMAARDMLTQAAVLGQEFSLVVLQALTGQSESVVLDTVEAAVTARLLVDRSATGEERFAFADDQVQEVLYETVTPLRRRRLHLRTGQAIEEVYAGGLDAHVEALAYHFRAGGDLRKALDYAIRAGERAYALSTWEQAIRHYETALDLLDRSPADVRRRVQVLERLTDLEWMLGRPGLDYAQQTLDLYVQSGDRRKAARMHGFIGGIVARGIEGEADWEAAMAHWQAAVQSLAEEPASADKSFVYGRYGYGALMTWLDLETAERYVEQSLALAEEVGDSDRRSLARTYLAMLLAYRGELERAERIAAESLELASLRHDPWVETLAILWPLTTWPWRNDRARAAHGLDLFRVHRERAHITRYDLKVSGYAAYVSALRGEPSRAADLLRLAEEAGARHPSHFRYFLHFAGAAHGILGDVASADKLLGESLAASEKTHTLALQAEGAAHYGRFLLARGDYPKAAQVLAGGHVIATTKGSVVQELNLLPLIAELHLGTGQLARAEQSLARAREILAAPQQWRGLTAAVCRGEGLLALARGSWAEAEQAFTQAIEVERAYGFPYHEAQHLVAWAELYFQRSESGDRERGLEKLDQALAIFERCAAKQDIAHVMARRAAVVISEISHQSETR
ncbi:MAG: AAA family ATPase [Chloroflexi bacterium]|nr:AAA family ATPase [Chloroflexota bacterium]